MTATTTNTSFTGSIFHSIAGFFASIGNGLVSLGEMNSLVREAEHLLSLTDTQLAAKGLRRDEIVPHVFSGYMAM